MSTDQEGVRSGGDAMAHHGYLELEGGHLMVEFIVRQCSLPDDPPVSLLSLFHRGCGTVSGGKPNKKNKAFQLLIFCWFIYLFYGFTLQVGFLEYQLYEP